MGTYYFDKDNAFGFDSPKYSIMDTGSSHIFIPNDYFQPVLDQISLASGSPSIAVEDGIAVADCNAAWSMIGFLMDKYWI